MFKHVIVAVDFTESYQRLKKRLLYLKAKGTEELTLIHIMSSRYPSVPEVMHEDHYRQLLATEKEILVKEGFHVHTELRTGDPGAELAQVANEKQADLLLIGSHSHGKLYEFFLGSTVLDAARRTVVPLWLEPVGPYKGDREKSGADLESGIILLATDGSSSVQSAEAMFERLEPTMNRAIALTAIRSLNQSAKETLKTDARKYLDLLRDRIPGLETRIEEGDPRKVVSQIADMLPAELVVIGKRGRNPLGDLLLGSAAENICRSSSVPVLLVPAS